MKMDEIRTFHEVHQINAFQDPSAGPPGAAQGARSVSQVGKNGGGWPAVSAGSFLLGNVTFREPSSQNRYQPESGSRAPEGSRNVTFPNRNEPAGTAGQPPPFLTTCLTFRATCGALGGRGGPQQKNIKIIEIDETH